MQPSRADAPVNRFFAQARREQLLPSHHSVLPLRQRR
jgi:hypothetical protein